MNTDYQIYFNYNNDKSVYCIPVNPEELQVTFKGKTTSANIDKFGEIMHKGKRDAAVVSFNSFFPPRWDQRLCVCSQSQFHSPSAWVNWMKALEEADKALLMRTALNIRTQQSVEQMTVDLQNEAVKREQEGGHINE